MDVLNFLYRMLWGTWGISLYTPIFSALEHIKEILESDLKTSLLELQNVKTECINDAQIKTRNSRYEGKMLVGSEKAPEERKEKPLHRSVLLKPADTQTSTEKPDLKDPKHQLNWLQRILLSSLKLCERHTPFCKL